MLNSLLYWITYIGINYEILESVDGKSRRTEMSSLSEIFTSFGMQPPKESSPDPGKFSRAIQHPIDRT